MLSNYEHVLIDIVYPEMHYKILAIQSDVHSIHCSFTEARKTSSFTILMYKQISFTVPFNDVMKFKT